MEAPGLLFYPRGLAAAGGCTLSLFAKHMRYPVSACLSLLLLAAAPAAAQPTATLVKALSSINGTSGYRLDRFDDQPYFQFAPYRGELYFAASDGTSGLEVWRTNGTPEGTALVADLVSGAAGSFPGNFMTYQGVLFFSADFGGERSTFVTRGFGAQLFAQGLVPVRPVKDGLLLQDGAGTRYILGTCGPDLTGPLCRYESLLPPSASGVQGSKWLYFTLNGEAYASLGTAASTVALTTPEDDDGVSKLSVMGALADKVFLRCTWDRDRLLGAELCSTGPTPGQVALEADLNAGEKGSLPSAYGVAGRWLYFRTQSPPPGGLYRVDAAGTLEGLPRVDLGSVQLFELDGVAYHKARLGNDGGDRIWRGTSEVLGFGGISEMVRPASDGRRAFVMARTGYAEPWGVYRFDGSKATLAGQAPAEVRFPGFLTVYNGGLLFTDGGVYALGVLPRAVRVAVGGSGKAEAPLTFEVYADADALPATFTPTAGVDAGEVRAGLVSRTRVPLYTDSGETGQQNDPAPALLDTYYAFDTSEGLGALRGSLTLSYRQADLDSAGIADANLLGVWQWDVGAAAWVALPIAARDRAASTVTVADVSPTSLFVLGTRTSVAAALPSAVPTPVLHPPFPMPAAHTATLRYALPEGGFARLELVDVLGRRVKLLAEGPHAAGDHETRIHLQGFAPGVYFVRLQARARVATTPLTIVR